MVQLCLANQQGLATMESELQSVAQSEKMVFLDNSRNTKESLNTIGYAGNERKDGSPVISLDVGRKDGMGLGVGNLGLPNYQVAVGFSEGSDAKEARQFANRVVERLKQHWRIVVVPAGTGAKPLASCP